LGARHCVLARAPPLPQDLSSVLGRIQLGRMGELPGKRQRACAERRPALDIFATRDRGSGRVRSRLKIHLVMIIGGVRVT
jgi:hypothetical protein